MSQSNDLPGSPRVTIGVPVYNGEEYLAETLDSLLSQTYDDFELVISDNASTDRTADICKEYAARDSRIRYSRNDRNLGGAYNYSRLVDLARGEYFKWASADDLCAPGFVAACLRVLESNPAVVIAYPQTMVIAADGSEIGPQNAGLHLPWVEMSRRLTAFAKFRQLCNPCFGVMRTAVVRSSSRIRPYVSSDITFLAEMAIAGEIHEVPEVLFFRRVTDTSCGLGSLSRAQVLAWFSPTSRRGGRAPLVRVFWKIIRAILASETPLADRAVTTVKFSSSWVSRTTRHRYRILRASTRHAIALRVRRISTPSG